MVLFFLGEFSVKISKDAVFYNAAVLAVSNIILQILGFAYRIFISRATGAVGMGVYQLIFPYYSIVMSVTLSGLCLAVSKISAERQALKDTTGIYRLVKLSIFIFLSLFVITTVLTLLFSEFIAGSITGDMRTRLSILLLLPCLFFTGFENIIKNCFFGIKKIKPAIIAQYIEQIIKFSAVVILFNRFSSKNPEITTALIVCAMVISEIFSSSTLIFFFRRYFKKTGETVKSGRIKLIGKIASVAVPISIAALADNIISSFNTILLPRRLVAFGLTHEAATETLGIISGMILPMVLLPAVLAGSLSTIIMPKLSEASALNNSVDIRRKAGKAFHVTSMLAFLSSAIMLPLAKTLCELVYKQTVPTRYLIPIIAACFFVYFQIVSVSMLNGIGLQKKAAGILIAGGIIELMFTYFATARFGIDGYITGFFITSVLMAVLTAFYVIKKTGLKIQFVNWFLIPAMSASASGLFSRLTFVMLSNKGIEKWPAVLSAAGVGICIFIIFLKLQGISFVRYFKTLAEKE